MSGYRGFPSKLEYEKYYSDPLPQWELDAMESYSREAEEERESFKMSDPTKACNLTEEEVMSLLIRTGGKFGWPNANSEELMERMKYLSSRLKTFRETDNVNNAKIAATNDTPATPTAPAWPSSNG